MHRCLIYLIALLWTAPLLAEEAAIPQTVFEQKCSRCHKLPDASKRTLPEWQAIVRLMQQIMQLKNVAMLSEIEEQLVLSYLQQQAKPSAPEPVGQAEKIFSVRCSLCHQLPEPDMLTSTQWKLMMRVMQQRMMQAGVPQLNEQEFDLVQGYLIERARQ